MKKCILIMALVFTVGITPAMVPGQTLNLDYSTYLGGSYQDYGCGICVGTDGRVYIAGETDSTDFPTENPYQAGRGAGSDVFVSVLSSTGSSLDYSTYLGGSSSDYGCGICVGTDGRVYIAGDTESDDFPTENPYQAGKAASMDLFVSVLSSTGSALDYSTYLGGSGSDQGHGISLGSSGVAYVTGYTASIDFPTEHPYQADSGGGDHAAFVSALTSTGSALFYSTYLGGTSDDYGFEISLGSDSTAYVTGFTNSFNFPTENPYQADYGGGDYDAFVTALTSTGSALFYSTYLGGSDDDQGFGISLETDGSAYVIGYTASSDFPTVNPYQAGYGGDYDAFVTALTSTGSALYYSTYLGGLDGEEGNGISLGTDGSAYVTGYTGSSDFPTANPYQAGFGGFYDAFVTALTSTGSAVAYSTYLGGADCDIGTGIRVGMDGSTYLSGYTSSSDFPTENPYQAGYGGGYCDVFVSRLTFTETPPWIYDYNGDGTSDIAIFRESSGLWAIRGITRVYFGGLDDEACPGDYDGDGTTDVGIFRPSSGLWALWGVSRIYFGGADDEPIPADYDGDGTSEPAVFRPAFGLWAARGVTRTYFGGIQDEHIPGYYSGMGNASIAIYRPDSGLWAVKDVTRIYFGTSTDDPVPGDYNGDGAWRPGIFRPSSGLWALVDVTRAYYGSSVDWPIPGEYSGDGTDDIGIFRSSSGLWAIRGVTRIYFGASNDIPVTR